MVSSRVFPSISDFICSTIFRKAPFTSNFSELRLFNTTGGMDVPIGGVVVLMEGLVVFIGAIVLSGFLAPKIVVLAEK